MNYKTLAWQSGIWRSFLEPAYRFVWENLKPEEDPETFYVLISDNMAKLDTDLSCYRRLVVICDDFAKTWKIPEDAPEDVVYLWYGLDDVPKRWQKTKKWEKGLHLWDATSSKILRKNKSFKHEVFLCGLAKRDRAKRLSFLLEGIQVACVGFDWSEYFPVAEHRPRVGGLLDSVEELSSRCCVELVYHSPAIKSFMSVRLPNILRRGNVPLIDFDHDPKRLLLITDKLRDNLYADNPKEVREACEFAKTVSQKDLQDEYDAQVARAIADMAVLRENLQVR